jgi:sortase A
MRSASRWLRRVEITLFVVGVSLLGVALGASVQRWNYQAEQERLLEGRMQVLEQAPRVIIPPFSSDDGQAADAPLVTSAGLPAPELSTGAVLDELERETLLAPREPETRRVAATPSTILADDPRLMGRIEIPRIGLSAIVLAGDDDATLRRAVGWVAGTARPDEGGNTALAGHRDTFFRPLQRVEIDDRVRLVVPPHTYEYRVDSIRVVGPDEVSVLDSTGIEELTLVTCYPFRLVGPAPDRFIVKAVRIEP